MQEDFSVMIVAVVHTLPIVNLNFTYSQDMMHQNKAGFIRLPGTLIRPMSLSSLSQLLLLNLLSLATLLLSPRPTLVDCMLANGCSDFRMLGTIRNCGRISESYQRLTVHMLPTRSILIYLILNFKRLERR